MMSKNESVDLEATVAAFRSAMRRLVATVTIVTTRMETSRVGMTATSVTSLSMDPPSLLVCVNRSASIHPVLVPGRRFCVNLLARNHQDLSARFGGKIKPEERFLSGAWQEDAEGVPYLMDAQASVFCAVEMLIGYGSHSVIIGRVSSVKQIAGAQPLVYGDGQFLNFHATP